MFVTEGYLGSLGLCHCNATEESPGTWGRVSAFGIIDFRIVSGINYVMVNYDGVEISFNFKHSED